MSEEPRELSAEELMSKYPKMLYRLKPNPSYTTAEDPAHEAKLIEQGWVTRDKLSARQVEACANQDRFQPVDYGDKTGNKGSAEAFTLFNIAFSEFREETNEAIARLEQEIMLLKRGIAEQPAPVPVETQEPETNEGEEGGETPSSEGETGEGATGQADAPEDPPQEARYKEIAPIIGQFLQQDPDKQDPDLWTKSGAPNATALSERLGSDVGAEERDIVWERFQRAQSRLPK